MLFISFAVFTICWTPYAILVVADFSDKLPMPVYLYVVMLAHLHASANWLVYAATNQHFRSGYRLVLSLLTCGIVAKHAKQPLHSESILTKNAEVQQFTNEMQPINGTNEKTRIYPNCEKLLNDQTNGDVEKDV